MTDADYWIKQLALEEHPEGGYFKEIHRSAESVTVTQLPGRLKNTRALDTSIYYLLQNSNVSHFHRLTSEEIWYFHAGGVARIHLISPEGEYSYKDIGPYIDKNQSLQVEFIYINIFLCTVS